jgi:signal transduction histidine kinase
MLSNADAAEMILAAGGDRRVELRAILADIRRDNLRASEVIRQIRALLDKRNVERQPVDVNDAVREVEALLASEARRRRVTLDIRSGAGAAAIVADRIQIQQVLLNLLLNARDAVAGMPDDRRAVAVSVQQTAQVVHVTVSDRGPGIAAEHLSRLFDSFFTTKSTGMGLGLPVSRSLVEAHGGRIWAENGRVEGAVFHVELPLPGTAGPSSPEQP